MFVQYLIHFVYTVFLFLVQFTQIAIKQQKISSKREGKNIVTVLDVIQTFLQLFFSKIIFLRIFFFGDKKITIEIKLNRCLRMEHTHYTLIHRCWYVRYFFSHTVYSQHKKTYLNYFIQFSTYKIFWASIISESGMYSLYNCAYDAKNWNNYNLQIFSRYIYVTQCSHNSQMQLILSMQSFTYSCVLWYDTVVTTAHSSPRLRNCMPSILSQISLRQQHSCRLVEIWMAISSNRSAQLQN